jgi:hypothetical protein
VDDPLSAALAREHNDANVLALGARSIGPDMAKACVQAFLGTEFAGGRHQRRVDQLSHSFRKATDGLRRHLNDVQPDGFFHRSSRRPIPRSPRHQGRARREQTQIELIARRISSAARARGAGLGAHQQICGGYPGRRYYQGCAPSDTVETLAIERAKQLFGCGFANVQPHSGAQANGAVMMALLKPGDTIMGMSLAAAVT